RRGIFFKSPDLQTYFSRFSWYRPTTWNLTLSRVEQQNVALLQQQEQAGGSPPMLPDMAPIPAPGRSAEFIFQDSDRRLLSISQLGGLSAAELRIARNEIYARRGIYFKSSDLRAYFERFSWYRPSTWEPALNPVESQNANLIKQVEVGR